MPQFRTPLNNDAQHWRLTLLQSSVQLDYAEDHPTLQYCSYLDLSRTLLHVQVRSMLTKSAYWRCGWPIFRGSRAAPHCEYLGKQGHCERSL